MKAEGRNVLQLNELQREVVSCRRCPRLVEWREKIARKLELLGARVIVCLGAFAWDAALRVYRLRPKPKFGHGAEAVAGAATLLGCYHPSQQNTVTGVLKPEMLDAVLLRARALTSRG